MRVNHENLVIIILISLHFMELQVTLMCRISSFRRGVHENCALLSYYGASDGNSLPTFQNKLKRRQGISNTRCEMTQQSAMLTYIDVFTNIRLISFCHRTCILPAVNKATNHVELPLLWAERNNVHGRTVLST
jgi:hypothetical protein